MIDWLIDWLSLAVWRIAMKSALWNTLFIKKPHPKPNHKYMKLINITQYLNVFLHCNKDTLK